MHESDRNPLGQPVVYPTAYDPQLLFAIARAPARAALGIGDTLPFHGEDVWNAYEVSWLDALGKPVVAIAECRVPAASPSIVESKSFKLYLNSFNQASFDGIADVEARMAHDISDATACAVTVALRPARRFADTVICELGGESIDDEPIAIDDYGPPNAAHLRRADNARPVDEVLVSHLLKSNCPVTGQPDWASVQVAYAGPRIDRAGLLRYIVSFRGHAGFHEQCVERIYVDLMRAFAPSRLCVHARYTRRGGLDINPWRSSEPGRAPNPRGARQ